jgi:hypothetical protein
MIRFGRPLRPPPLGAQPVQGEAPRENTQINKSWLDKGKGTAADSRLARPDPAKAQGAGGLRCKVAVEPQLPLRMR